jgi:hypothetical protein
VAEQVLERDLGRPVGTVEDVQAARDLLGQEVHQAVAQTEASLLDETEHDHRGEELRHARDRVAHGRGHRCAVGVRRAMRALPAPRAVGAGHGEQAVPHVPVPPDRPLQQRIEAGGERGVDRGSVHRTSVAAGRAGRWRLRTLPVSTSMSVPRIQVVPVSS